MALYKFREREKKKLNTQVIYSSNAIMINIAI